MTFPRHLRGLALCALLTVPVAAQNGANFHVMSNSVDVIYAGMGAGTAEGQQPGLDGFGFWLDGEDIVGNTMTELGDFGYKQSRLGVSACINNPGLEWPMIMFIEYDGRNPYTPDVFITPTATGGVPTGMTTGGFLPYGTSDTSSVSFVLAGLPSSLPVTEAIIPENGILNGSATATIIAAASGALNTTSGGCFVVHFTWAPSALASLDRITGWWMWTVNASDGDQYVTWSNDELELFQSQTIASTGGVTDLIAFRSNLDLEWHSLTQAPSTNLALAPVGLNQAGPYYAAAAAPACSTVASTMFNVGVNLGRSGGWSLSGTGGTLNPASGLSNQDPTAAGVVPAPTPTLGFVSWDNQFRPDLVPNGGGPAGDVGGTAVSWFHVSLIAAQLVPTPNTDATNPSIVVGPPSKRQRYPNGVDAFSFGSPFFLEFAMDKCDAMGDTNWGSDPWGLPGGVLNVPPVIGMSALHLPGFIFGTVDQFGFLFVMNNGYVPTINPGTMQRGFAALWPNHDVGEVSNNAPAHTID